MGNTAGGTVRWEENAGGKVTGWAWALASGVLSLGIFWLLYGDAVGLFFDWDDLEWVGAATQLEMRRLRDLGALFQPGPTGFILYRPLSQRGYFWILRQLFGLDSAGYHAAQLLASALVALLVYCVAARLLRSRAAALCSALLYALAPGHATAALWLGNFCMTGPAIWYFAALLVWLRNPSYWRVPVCFALYAVGLLHGEHAVTLPLAISSFELLCGKRENRRLASQLAPFYALMAAYAGGKMWAMHRAFAVQAAQDLGAAWLAQVYGTDLSPSHLLDRLGFYAANSVSWLYWCSPTEGRAMVLGAAFLLAACGLAVWARRKPEVRPVLFAVVLFVLALGPVLGLAKKRSGYLVGIAAAGPAIALSAAVRLLPARRALYAALVVAAAIAEGGYAARRVREEAEMGFRLGFSQRAAGWLVAVEREARRHREVQEVRVPANFVTQRVFTEAQGHRVFYGAEYRVRLVSEGQAAVPDAGVPFVARAPIRVPVYMLPGRNAKWDWLRWLPGGPCSQVLNSRVRGVPEISGCPRR